MQFAFVRTRTHARKAQTPQKQREIRQSRVINSKTFKGTACGFQTTPTKHLTSEKEMFLGKAFNGNKSIRVTHI